MTNQDLQQLKALALAATPGPWETDSIKSEGEYGTDDDGGYGYMSYEVTDNKGHCILDFLNNEDGEVHVGHDGHAWDEVAKKNATFVAAAAPNTILALIEHIESLAAPAVTNPQHDPDCSTNNRGVPEALGPCDCSVSAVAYVAQGLPPLPNRDGDWAGDDWFTAGTVRAYAIEYGNVLIRKWESDHAAIVAQAPQAALTDEQIIAAWDAQRQYHGGEPCKVGHVEFARAIEAAKKAALTDGDIERIGRALPAMQNKSYRFLHGQSMTVPEHQEYDTQIAFARAIEAAAAPNVLLVEALQNILTVWPNDPKGRRWVQRWEAALDAARATLANAGVKVTS